jgi:Tfp pilus assembly protein PilP
VPIGLAVRDIFSLEQKLLAFDPLEKANIEDLSFVGAIITKQKQIGFIKDPLGNVYSILLGQFLTSAKNKVIKILPDQIIVANGQSFEVIN